jgi:HAD superfamily hydrolase (TIGR01450 family)
VSSCLRGSSTPLVEGHRHVLLDLDGVVYRGRSLVPGADKAIEAVRRDGVRVTFITNNASRTPESVADHLRGFGVEAHARDVVTSAVAAARFVAEEFPGRAVLPIGGDGVLAALREVDVPTVASADDGPAVVLIGFGPDVGWRDLAEACIAVQRGARLVATNLDTTVPSDRGLLPANGALVDVVRAVTGVEPIAAGKPEPIMFREATDEPSDRVVVVGDRIDTDLRGATELGMDTMHVLSGAHGVRDVLLAPVGDRPRYVGADLSALLEPHPAPTARSDGTWVCRDASARIDGDVLALDGVPGVDQFRAACAAVWTRLDAGRQVDITAAGALDDLLRQV